MYNIMYNIGGTMDNAMVTGRMSQDKKDAGNAVLQRAGLTPSAAINRMYDLLLERGNADFLAPAKPTRSAAEWTDALEFVKSLQLPFAVDSRFETMSIAQIKAERLAARGLM